MNLSLLWDYLLYGWTASEIVIAVATRTGKDGRVTKGDMLAAIERAAAQPTPPRCGPRHRRNPGCAVLTVYASHLGSRLSQPPVRGALALRL